MKKLSKQIGLSIFSLLAMFTITFTDFSCSTANKIKEADFTTTPSEEITPPTISFPEQKNYEDFYEKQEISIKNLKYFQKAYPELNFSKKFDKTKNDWLITITKTNGHKFSLYWCNGKMLPESQLKNKDNYWSILTYYPKSILDPSTLPSSIVEDILELGSTEDRLNGKRTPMFFFDELYDTKTQDSTEEHIARLPFINRWINVHEDIEKPLNRLSDKMWAASKTNKEVYDFIYSIKVYEVYSWRHITGTSRKSFHSLGIAIDALPRNMGNKQIFWSWTKRWNPNTWPTTPLSQRWMPPESVIKIFESEGFAWGGKWALFDNMHFEYRPELLLYNNIN